MATCYRHPSRETGVACSNCGRPICPDCMTPTSVGMRCPECAKDRTPVRTMRSLGGDPIVTYVLIGISVLAFLGSSVSGGGLASGGGGGVIDNGALSRAGIADGHYWTLISSGFLHAGLVHIGFNMYLLYILGHLIEPSLGRVRFAILYFVSLLGGSFGALLLSSPQSVTVGASGAVFGLMGGAVVAMRARGFDPRASGIPGLILFNLAFSFLFPGISIGGHIGGLIAGAAAAFILVQVGDRQRSQIPALVGCLLLGAAAVAGSLAVAGGSGLG